MTPENFAPAPKEPKSATTVTDQMPTTAQVWLALRRLFGKRMLGASVVVVGLDGANGPVLATYTFPTEPKETP